MTGTCIACGKPLPIYSESQEFRDAAGRQEYHVPAMAQFLAGTDGREVLEWHVSARESKAGLVTGYDFNTGLWGADGAGLHCSMQCQATDALRAPVDQGTARATGGHETAGVGTVDASIDPIKAIPREITARRMQQIRRLLKLSANAFAMALGYNGAKESNDTIIHRFECGARPIPPAVGRLAAMFELYGVPKLRRMDYGQEQRGPEIPGGAAQPAQSEHGEATETTATTDRGE